jgi:hypothetical protein
MEKRNQRGGWTKSAEVFARSGQINPADPFVHSFFPRVAALPRAHGQAPEEFGPPGQPTADRLSAIGYCLFLVSPTPLPFPAVLRVISPVDWPATERD